MSLLPKILGQLEPCIKKKLIPVRNLVLFSCGNTAVFQLDYFVQVPLLLPSRSCHTLLKFSRSLYLDNQLSESVHTWTLGTL